MGSLLLLLSAPGFSSDARLEGWGSHSASLTSSFKAVSIPLPFLLLPGPLTAGLPAGWICRPSSPANLGCAEGFWSTWPLSAIVSSCPLHACEHPSFSSGQKASSWCISGHHVALPGKLSCQVPQGVAILEETEGIRKQESKPRKPYRSP